MLTLTFAFDPIIAQIGPFQLGWHGLFTALAVAVGLWLAGRLARQRGIPSDLVSGVALWAVVGGVIGARLFHVLDHLPFYLQNPLLIPAVWEGGIAVYGAFIGGLLAGGIAAWRARADVWQLLDIAAPSMLLGQRKEFRLAEKITQPIMMTFLRPRRSESPPPHVESDAFTTWMPDQRSGT